MSTDRDAENGQFGLDSGGENGHFYPILTILVYIGLCDILGVEGNGYAIDLGGGGIRVLLGLFRVNDGRIWEGGTAGGLFAARIS